MAEQVAQRQRRERPWRVARVVYLVAAAGLIVFDYLYAEHANVTSHTIEAIGAITFAIGVYVHRPTPRLAWWLSCLGFLLLAASGVAAIFAKPSSASHLVNGLAGSGLFWLAAGLMNFSRRATRRALIDSIDATVIALAAYLVLWILLIAPTLRYNPHAALAAGVLPIGALLVLVAASRLALAGAWRVPALAVLVAISFAVVLAFALVLSNGLPQGKLWVNEALFLLANLYFVALGWLGLSPSLLRRAAVLRTGEEAPSRRRIALFAALAVVPPLIWLFQVSSDRVADGWGKLALIPPVISAAFLLLLVLRIGLVSGLAERRADDLACSVQEQVELQHQLRYQAEHDPLTGLFNRAVLGEVIEAALRAPAVQPLALLLLDLDQFKDVNDTLGHPIGDQLLIQIASRLRQVDPIDGTLVRLGGDEFAIVLDESHEGRAAQVAEDVVRELRPPYLVDGHTIRITTSVGVGLSERDGHARTSRSELLRIADRALYSAKAAGKDRVRVFSASGTTNGTSPDREE